MISRPLPLNMTKPKSCYNYTCNTHTSCNSVNNKFKPEKFPYPTLEFDSTADTWADFQVTRHQYKLEYNQEGPGLICQLYACCLAKLKTSLSKLTSGKPFYAAEDELLAYMKQLAVRH